VIITARQLEDLHKSHGGNGHVTLPYRARLTPLAVDFVKARKLVVGYSDVAVSNGAAASAPGNPAAPGSAASQVAGAINADPGIAQSPVGTFLWWCDGPCGPAKAAIVAEEKLSTLRPLQLPSDGRQMIGAIKAIAIETRSGKSAGGVLLVQNAALATVFANRCPSLRAVVGTCLEAVEHGVVQAAANVLIVEYPQKTLQQMRNMLSRFLRAPRTVSPEIKRQLEELASCG